jgi:hypothetical protein
MTLAWLLLVGFAVQPPVVEVEFQPFASQVRRVVETLDFLGEPLPAEVKAKVLEAINDPKGGVKSIQQLLDPHVLTVVTINPESRVKSQRGPCEGKLMQNGWRNFLVKVINEGGVTAPLKVESPNAAKIVRPASNRAEPQMKVTLADVPQRFLDVLMHDKQPLEPTLSGLSVEYRILQAYCRDSGQREATLSFSVGPGTQDVGFRSETHVLFNAEPATEVTLEVRDADGSPTMASFTFRDKFGRVYPAQARRLAPDFFFHPQVYRANGESIRLPPAEYDVEIARGPEYRIDKKKITVPASSKHTEKFQLRRWIELKKLGWWSGDHHVHGAGCAHYDNPTQGVTPEDMFRHILGEDLNVGCVLSWGPCWYHQKQFFDGKVHPASTKNYLMRYDVEVSGFPSSHCGHLCLLNLKEDDYPNTSRIEEWPSWDLPVLQWAKKQGAVVGFSHSAPGLNVRSTELPNYLIPPMDGIGANEYIVDVAHDACDFISTVDTQAPAELNIWYHTLNCGFEAKISGETDFPCIFGSRVGVGRAYVHLPNGLDFDSWVKGIKDGRSYVSDGFSHLVDFKVNGGEAGTPEGKLSLPAAAPVKATVRAAALLAEKPDESIRGKSLMQPPYWHVERSRIGDTNTVPVEVVVNGKPVAKKTIVGDGSLQDLAFDVPIEHSSWVALRIYPSSHTNPVFIRVGDKPIRASKKSAQWCADSVDQCWKKKSQLIRREEIATAKQAFDQAKAIYLERLKECVAE